MREEVGNRRRPGGECDVPLGDRADAWDGTPTTQTPPTGSTTVRITLQVAAPVALYSGDIYYRAGSAAI